MELQSYNNTSIDDIYKYDRQHCNKDKINGDYYIGVCDNKSHNDILLLSMSMSANAFFKYAFIDSLKYMYYYGLTLNLIPKVEVMKLHILDDGTYSTSIKTHWIKIIQRHWKKTYKLRIQKIQHYMSVNANKTTFELACNYPKDNNDNKHLPSIKGMLSDYA